MNGFVRRLLGKRAPEKDGAARLVRMGECLIERFPSEAYVEIHARRRFAHGRRFCGDSFGAHGMARMLGEEKDGPPKDVMLVYDQPKRVRDLYAALKDLFGVVAVDFHAYSVHIEKGAAFDWADLLPAAVALIEKEVTP